jgi:hypothetical protein
MCDEDARFTYDHNTARALQVVDVENGLQRDVLEVETISLVVI